MNKRQFFQFGQYGILAISVFLAHTSHATEPNSVPAPTTTEAAPAIPSLEDLPPELVRALRHQFPQLEDPAYRARFLEINRGLIQELTSEYASNPARLREIARAPQDHVREIGQILGQVRLPEDVDAEREFRRSHEIHIGVTPTVSSGVGYSTRANLSFDRSLAPQRGVTISAEVGLGETSPRAHTSLPYARAEFRLRLPESRLRNLSRAIELASAEDRTYLADLHLFLGTRFERNESTQTPWSVDLIGGVEGEIVRSRPSTGRTQTLNAEVRGQVSFSQSLGRLMPWVGTAILVGAEDCRRTRLGENDSHWNLCMSAQLELILGAVYFEAGSSASLELARQFETADLSIFLRGQTQFQAGLAGSIGAGYASIGISVEPHGPQSTHRREPEAQPRGEETDPLAGLREWDPAPSLEEQSAAPAH